MIMVPEALSFSGLLEHILKAVNQQFGDNMPRLKRCV